jgi:hypothetical protein
VIEEIGSASQGRAKSFELDHFVLEPIRASPYRPAAWSKPHIKA